MDEEDPSKFLITFKRAIASESQSILNSVFPTRIEILTNLADRLDIVGDVSSDLVDSALQELKT